jgi:hypothetical protein
MRGLAEIIVLFQILMRESPFDPSSDPLARATFSRKGRRVSEDLQAIENKRDSEMRESPSPQGEVAEGRTGLKAATPGVSPPHPLRGSSP